MIRLVILLLFTLFLTGCTLPGGTPVLKEDIVILGGGFDGSAAARSAAAAAPKNKILLVVNDPIPELVDWAQWEHRILPIFASGRARWLPRAPLVAGYLRQANFMTLTACPR
ncbi:hypothetical protein N752_00315 [Desulforamulus aquiferis]|nr:hypothetical protein [Desulforamulus aquiferis]RYD07058.1 hypothetical protein N752_00315 [Desulforamulus aquiferis]